MRHDPRRALLLALPLLGLLGLAGCNTVLPADLKSQLASDGSADEHMAAATLYQNEAKQYEAKANQYEAEAAKIGVLEDTKGFRRRALQIAAEENRNKAKRMEELYAAQLEKAQTLYGKKSPE
jgi:protein subunit release factor B